MKNANIFLAAMGCGALVAGGAAANGQTAKPADKPASSSMRYEARIGAESNSNVAIPDLDSNTGSGDTALTLNLLAEGTLKPADRMTLHAGYDFSQTLHQDFDAFDLQIHRGYAEAAYEFSWLTLGVLGNLAHARLDNDSYLDFSQISPYVSKQFGDYLFLRGAYAYTDKLFDGRPTRDATSDAATIDAYFFLDGTKRYVSVGAKSVQEDAVSDELDFSSGSAKARIVQRVDLLGHEMTFRAGGEYEVRDYDNPTLSIGAPRKDKRTTLDLQLEAPISGHVLTELSYRYGDYSSNLASADYNEHVASVKIGLRY